MEKQLENVLLKKPYFFVFKNGKLFLFYSFQTYFLFFFSKEQKIVLRKIAKQSLGFLFFENGCFQLFSLIFEGLFQKIIIQI